MIVLNSHGSGEGQTEQAALISFVLKHYNKFLTGAEITADLAAIFSAFLASSTLFLYQNPTLSHRPRHTIVALATSAIGILVFERLGLYRKQVSLMNLVEIRKIIRAVFVLSLGLLAYSYLQKVLFPRSLFIYVSCSMLLFVLIERMLFFKLQQALYLRKFNVRRILILGAGEEGHLLFHSISQAPKLGYFVVGFLDENDQRLDITKERFARGKKHTLFFCNDFSKLTDLIHNKRIDEIFVSNHLHVDEAYPLRQLATICNEMEIKLNFIPHVSGYSSKQLQVHDINGIPVISYGPFPLSQATQLDKRIFDLALVALSLPFLWPIFLFIAILIRRDSKGPVFFKQDRVGINGTRFAMYKFRTMYVDTPPYTNSPKSSHDPRITRVGLFLRRTSLDEFPQIINVIKGEMSLVGPRPEMPYIVENEYNDLHRERLRVKPGITGVWQISGDRTREIHENISYDIFYIENRSLLLDVIIIIRTLIFGVIAMRTH